LCSNFSSIGKLLTVILCRLHFQPRFKSSLFNMTFFISIYRVVHKFMLPTQLHHHHHNRFTALFPDHPGEPVPEENFWTLWCKGRLTEADTPTIRMGATPSGLVTSAHLNHPSYFLQAGCPSCRPTNSVKAPKATSAFGSGRRRRSSPQRCYLYHFHTVLCPFPC